ncbi:MAG TPA: histidine phosphatase family protein [Myxococcota bacterium]|jgi:broad specificity phosphatase PhoE
MSLLQLPCTLTIVRHGETPANTGGLWHGSLDTPLTPRGERQAERVALHVARTRGDASALYASTLTRARRTAAPIGARLGVEVRPLAALCEYDLGAWEGKSYAELMREHRLFERMAKDPDWRPGGGESARGVATRIAGALQGIAERHRGERVVVVTHGGALTLGLGLLLDRDPSTWRRVMDNAAVAELQLEPAPRLLRFNETQHLDGLA